MELQISVSIPCRNSQWADASQTTGRTTGQLSHLMEGDPPNLRRPFCEPQTSTPDFPIECPSARITETGAEILTRPPPISLAAKKKKKKGGAKANGTVSGEATPTSDVAAGVGQLAVEA